LAADPARFIAAGSATRSPLAPASD
jgi:hypothetical protein